MTVSAAGCFCTLTITAGCPLKPASPRFTAAAWRTSAICSSSTGALSRYETARPRRSSSCLVRPRLRIRYSRPLRSIKPPLVFAAKSRKARVTCSSVTPNCAMRAVSGSTRSWRTSPPIGMTCETPGTDSRRGRSTKSAYSRAAMGLAISGSMGNATSMISPMIDDTGPRIGVSPPGSCSLTSASRSDTSCRLR
ncbi:hypothetical protein D3C85_1241250 [compost metagenome]